MVTQKKLKKAFANFMSPKGIARYPRLDQPYTYSQAQGRSVPDAVNGSFDTSLLVPIKEAQPMIEQINATIKEAGITPEFLPYREHIEKDTGEKTGQIEFKFKAYGRLKNGSPNKILFFDAKGRPVQSDLYLTSGSTIRCLGYISVSQKSARLNLKEVQVIDLIERSASGFDAVDGGTFMADEDDNNNNTAVSFANAASPQADERPAF